MLQTFSRINIFYFLSARDDPLSGNLKMSQSFYYQGNCKDKDVQDKLKSTFHNYLVKKDPALSCLIVGAQCNASNVKIYCGATDNARRRRRGVNEMEVNL